MDRETARKLLLDALRRADKQALAGYLWSQAHAHALQWQEECPHCRHRMHPLSRQLDFEELAVSFECSLCGRRSQRPLQGWDPTGPLQPPPAS
jgi:hypothetical protein